MSHSFMPLQNLKTKKSSLFWGLDRGQNDRPVAAGIKAHWSALAAFHKESESIKKSSKVIVSNHLVVFYKNTNKISSNKAAENFLKCS